MFARFFTILCGLCLIAVAIFGLVANIMFDRNCEGYLKRAADSNTIGLAEKNLEKALQYIEAEEMTTGYSSVLWRTPDQDVGFWYENLKASLAELKRVDPNASQLEQSNVLMKLRETLLDEGQSVSVTSPSHIAIFPSQRLVIFGGVIMLICTIFGGLMWASEDNRRW
ncbi:MAG: hypothetical protein NUW02_01915 [Candidatus Campbellbacteria bacterium]|nr:hypothetical protein [Candidatus Campbellbacteria bacterium]